MPKFKNLAVLAAAVQAGRRYARTNPDKAAKYVDQAASFVDKQTKGRYSGQIGGVVGKVKGAAGLPQTSGTGGYPADAGYGAAGYGTTPPVTPPVTPSTTTPPSTATGPSVTRPATGGAGGTTGTRGTGASTNGPSSTPSTPSPLTTTRPGSMPTGPDKPTERNLPGSKDV